MRKKITVEQLRLGMDIEVCSDSWWDHPFLRSQFVLRHLKEIAMLRESGIQEVWIHTNEDDVVSTEAADEPEESAPWTAADATPSPTVPERLPLEQELQRAASICATAKKAVVSMFQEARMGEAIQAERAQPLVEEISSSILRNPGALISLARLKTVDDYTYMHSVAVCALMISLARQLRLPEEQVQELGMAGLLHDIGKVLMPRAALKKSGNLTVDEFVVMQRHPEAGESILRRDKSLSEIVIDVCLHHHEKKNGSGYPHGLKSDEISLFARMGAVCDVYDAITSNRPYRAGWNPAESIHRMAQWQDHFDETVFHAFVKSLGIYPVGSLVRLESGHLGVVIGQGEKSLLSPRVRVFFSIRPRGHIKPEIVDLSQPGCQDRIVSCENAAKWGITNLDRHWAGDLARPDRIPSC